MTHEDKGHYAKKHSSDLKVNPGIAQEVEKKSSNQEISCIAAHKIAGQLNVDPSEVGISLDLREIRITKCQLGLFGYSPAKKVVKPTQNVPKDVQEAIRQAIVDERLSCKDAWEIAASFGMKKMEVSSICEALQIKISSCQLGGF